MPDEFPYDVFLSHSAQDQAVVRPLAERLRADGVKVWFDEWVLKPGDSIEKEPVEDCEDRGWAGALARVFPRPSDGRGCPKGG